mmetsp:Transcript_18202/g.50990  ORF Transcript_18202/g.50990 Transcript_18202/m.50990 type:complete len:436 (-) Transcript_18202:488-1795(-)
MADAALASAGARVVAATCYDERHPPESVIDGDDSTFWVTTGLYPQEIVVALPKLTDVTRLTTVSMNVRKLVIEKCETDRPYTFEKALEAELTNMGSRGLQTETHQVNFKAKYVKVVFESGYDLFSALSKVAIVSHTSSRNMMDMGDTDPAPVPQQAYDEEEEEEEEEGSDGQLTYVLAQIDTPRGLSQQGISPDSSGCGWLGQQSGTYSGITDLSAATPTSEDGGGALPFSFSSLDSRLMMSTLSGGPITALEPSEGWTSSLDGALPSPHGPGDPHRDPISRSGPPWFPLEATTPQGKHCISGTLGQEDGWPSVDLSQLFEAMGHQQPGTPPVGRGGGGGHREPSSPGFSLPTLSRDSSSWLGDVASSSSGPLGSRSMMPSRLDQQQPHLLQRQQQQQPEASSGYPPADSSIAAATASKEEGEEEGQGWPATGGE